MSRQRIVILMVLAGLLLPSELVTQARPVSSTAADLAGASRALLGPTIYVDAAATGAGDGSTWGDAFTDLQAGLADASSGEEVWVAQGTYLPTTGITRTLSFQLASGVAVYGGFPAGGGDGTFEARDPDAYLTVLSGDIGDPGDYTDNSIHVVDGSGADATAVLDGFTITGGYADGSNPHWNGGGLFVQNGSPRVSDCILVGNRATYGGGGVYSNGGSPVLTDVTLMNNVATYYGGGVYNFESSLKIYNARFLNNNGGYSGGGITTVQSGTGVVVANAIFSGNTVLYDGGGIYVWSDSPALRNLTLYGNRATHTSGEGGGIYQFGGSPTIMNVILWANTATYRYPQIGYDIAPPAISNCVVQGGYSNGTGIITDDPLLADPDGADDTLGTLDDDLRLSPGSPAADAGTNAGVPADVGDLDGDADTAEPLPLDLDRQARFVDLPDAPDTGVGTPPLVDIGAYERSRTCWARLNDSPADYGTVQDAVDASTAPDDLVKVAGYCGGVTARGGLTQTLYLSTTLTVQGGYTPTFAGPPDPVVYPTVLDAGGGGRVVSIVGDVSPTVQGLHLTGGDAAGLGGSGEHGDRSAGGGAYIITATATISNCWIYDNTAEGGAGVAAVSSGAQIRNNQIYSNTGTGLAGGGVAVALGAPTVSGNHIYDNDSYGGRGGGMECIFSLATITGNTFENNYTNEYGGALAADNCQGATISGNTVVGNTADQDAGGMSLYEMDGATVSGNVISGNHAYFAGGLGIIPHGVITLTGNLISGNTAVEVAGAYFAEGIVRSSGDRIEGNVAAYNVGGALLESAIVQAENLLVADNEAESGDVGGLYLVGAEAHLGHPTLARNTGTALGIVTDPGVVSTATLTNSIIAAQTVGVSVDGGNLLTLNGVLWDSGTPVTVSASITATVDVQHQLVGDPAFDADGYHLTAASDAIDQGVDSGLAVDIDGDPRPYGFGYDLGADEALVDLPIQGLAATNDSPTTLGGATTLTATVTAGSPVTFTWSFGDETGGEGAVVAHTYPAVGVYTATVTAWNSVSSLTTTTQVVIQDVPITGLAAVNDSPTELGSVTHLTATVAAGTNVLYQWDLGDGTTAAGPAASYTYPAVGVYTAVVTATNGVGEMSATTTVTITDAPIAGLTAVNDSPTELGGLTTFTATAAAGSNLSYQWDFGDGTGASGNPVSHTYPAVGFYTAIVTASNDAGEVSATTPVTITDVPVAGLVATNDSPTELGGLTHLTATVAAGSNVDYLWDLGDGTLAAGATVGYQYPAVGVYTAVVTATNGAGEVTASTTVTITDVPISGLTAANDGPTELGDPTTLSASVASGSNVIYTWDLGDGEGAAGAVVGHTYPAAGVYTAMVTATNSLSQLTASTVVTVTFPACQARIDGDPALYRTVQAAVDAAAAGDLIRVSGHCVGLNGYGYPYEQVRLTKSVTLRGGYSPDFGTWDPALYPTILDAQGLGRVVYVTGGTPTVPVTPTLESLHLTGADSSYSGGGLYSMGYSHVTISDCAIYGNSAQSGGGLYLGDDATVLDNEIYGNTVDTNYDGAGLLLKWSDGALIQGNHIYSNTGAVANGYFRQGAVYLEGNTGATLRDNEIHDNGGTNMGGGVSLYNNTGTTLDSNRIYGHTSSEGAGVYLRDEVGLTLTGNELYDNHGNEGGAIGMEYGAGLTLIDNLIHDNTATSSGAGVNIFQGPDVTLSGNQIRDNTANYGGGINIYQSDGITLTANAFVGNAAVWYGGGIRVMEALTVTLSGNQILGNTADHGGGGLVLSNLPDATLVNNIIADNRHTAGYAAGGLQVTSSQVDMVHNTVARNTAWGVYAFSDATLAMTDTIVAGHAVGVYVGTASTVTLEATLWGSGDWANTTDWTVSAGTLSTGTLELWGDPAFVDPDWDNYHVLPASDAVDAGIDAGVAVDIDGDSRPAGAGFDIGADEVTPDDPVGGLAATNDSPMELRDATTLTATVTAGENVVFDWDLGDGTTAHGPVVEHVYPAVGTFTAVVTASNSTNWATTTTVVTITDNVPIVLLWATNDGPTPLGKGTNLMATAVGGSNVVYSWDFGDQSPPALDAGPHVVHTYPAVGSYTAVVTASNSTSLFTASTTVQVERTCWARLNDDPTDYPTVQAALDAATTGDLVKVSGTCLDQVPYSGRTTSLYVNKTLTVRGGYRSDFAAWDPDLYPATLDGEGNDYVIVVGNGVAPALEYLRITNGLRMGIYADYGDPLIHHCEIDHNGNPDTGLGGAYLYGADNSELSDSRIHHNQSMANGGGLTINNSPGFSLAGNDIFANRSGVDGRGGGVYLLDSPNATVSGNRIYANQTAGYAWGGGICVYTSDNVTLAGNRIYDHAAYTGGGIYFFSPGGTLADNWVYWNAASYSAGGIRIGSQDVELVNNVVVDNRASLGAGIEVNGGSAHMAHNTVARNRVWSDMGYWIGDGLFVPSGSVWMTDTLIAAQPVGVNISSLGVVEMEATFWGDGAWANGDDWTNWGGTLDTGTINVHGDPAFVNPANANYHLLAASAARDVGIDAGVPADVDGQARPYAPGIDIGADEYLGDTPILSLAASNDGPTAVGQATHLEAAVSAGTLVDYAWDLGDGTAGHGPLVEHDYAEPGLYSVVVTATNNAGWDTASTLVTVYELVVALPGGGQQLTSDGVLGFEWPPETAGAMRIVYTPQVVPTYDPGDFALAGVIFHLDVTDEFGDPITSFSPPMTVTVYYDEAGLPPETAEADLELRRYDVDLAQWVRPVQVLDVEANTIVVTLDHFSEFALMVPAEPGGGTIYLPLVVRH